MIPHYSNLKKSFYYITSKLLDFIAPAHCTYCKKFLSQHAIFCDPCNAKLAPVVTIMLPVTAAKSIKVFAAAKYDEPIKTLIVSKSWSDFLASKHLGQLIWERTDIRYAQFDYIVPIPLHWIRFAKRGYNQAEEIAREISKHSGKPVVNPLKRLKRTKFQSEVTGQERISNVEKAFILAAKSPLDFKDKHLLLVDDLMTTGATLRSAAKILFTLKPASISVAVASRVVK